MSKFHGTREVIIYAQKYISGKTIDFGAGERTKYREIIKQKSQEYIAFDTKPGKNIDATGDVLDAPFGDGTFDTVISTQVLEHVEKPWLMVKEIRRILKENGICILTAPFMLPYHSDPHDYFRYSKEGIRSLFENEGFKIIECDYYDKVFATLSEMIRFIFFNHYKKKPGVLSQRFMEYLAKSAQFLDKFVKTDIIYANVYIIARK